MIELCHNRHPCASIYHLGFTAQKRREPFLCVHRGKPRNVASIRVKNDCSRRYCDTSINYPYTDKGHPHTEKPTIILIRYYYTDESFLGFSGERKTIVNACFLISLYQHLHRGSILLVASVIIWRFTNTWRQSYTLFFNPQKKKGIIACQLKGLASDLYSKDRRDSRAGIPFSLGIMLYKEDWLPV